MSTRTERWSIELLVRYGCATLVTWIAAAGAQLVVRTDFVIAVALLSSIGIPVSLYLRMHSMRIAGVPLSRPLWNTFTVIGFFVCASAWTVSSMSEMMGLIFSGASQNFWLRFGADASLGFLMQVFLLFAAFRSFALISDKDATLATVPSFSVLLLLVPVHRGIEVVLYFLLWTLVSTVLFALDHRGELHTGTNGIVAAPQPGQDMRMAARGLGTVLCAALLAAFSLSALLTSRNADDRSATESAITGLVGRLAQFAMNAPDNSSGSGPERQIDFSSGPQIPSRTVLWRARVTDVDRRLLRPNYFRLFTLSQYNGSTWTQAVRTQKQISVTSLTRKQWTLPPAPRVSSDVAYQDTPRVRRSLEIDPYLQSPRLRLDRWGTPVRGFALDNVWPATSRSYGEPTLPVVVRLSSAAINLGYIPTLPGTRTLLGRSGKIDEIRSVNDGAIDLGFIPLGQNLLLLNDLPSLTEYGVNTGSEPTKNVPLRSGAPQLSEEDRNFYLQVPTLSSRVHRFAQNAISKAPTDENALGKARRLALAIQQGATYTLHPPIPATGREATDFFLFEGNRRGYCTHFASALTVLCREQNIPARIVSGFSSQEYSSEGWAVLREANAHAWTEVWVDNWGWALVDATPSADRGDNAPNFFSYWGDWLGFAFNQVATWSEGRLWIVGLIGAGLLVGIYTFRRRARVRAWWARRRGRVSSDEWTRREIIASYDLAAVRLSRLFRPRATHETPDEWLSAASEAIKASPHPKPFAHPEFERLTRHYLQALYSPRTPSDDAVTSARNLAHHVRRYKKAAS